MNQSNKIFSIEGLNEIPILAHIPHSSTTIPDEYMDIFSISNEELQQEINLLTDWSTHEIFSPIAKLGGSSLKSNVSRLVMDPERFDCNEKEPMAERGMGAIYTHGSQQQRLKHSLTTKQVQDMMDLMYYPYHKAFNDLTSKVKEKHGYCTIIDCHSFFKDKLPYELLHNSNRPSVCLGVNNEKQTPEWIVNIIKTEFESNNLEVKINTPFTGSIIPSNFTHDECIYSIMIEINRKIYMDDHFNCIPGRIKALSHITKELSIKITRYAQKNFKFPY